MFDIPLTPEVFTYASSIVATHNLGNRGRGDGNEIEQLTGMIGQTMIADLLNQPRPTGTEGFDHGADFIINNKKLDVKTMTRTTEVRDYYVHNFIGYQIDYPTEFYLFLSYNKNARIITVCGLIDKATFLKKAMFYKKGSKRYRSNGTYFYSKAPLYEIKQSDLIPVNRIEDITNLIK